MTVSSIAEISFTETHVDLQSSSLLSSSVNICQHLNQGKLYNTDKVDVCLLKREKEYFRCFNFHFCVIFYFDDDYHNVTESHIHYS